MDEQRKVAGRILQIDSRLEKMEAKRQQFREYLDKLSEDDPVRGKIEELADQNGLAEVVELLHERARLTGIADPAVTSKFKLEELQPLITEDLKEAVRDLLWKGARQPGGLNMGGCSIGRCVECVMCPSTCATVCETCVHCPSNGTFH